MRLLRTSSLLIVLIILLYSQLVFADCAIYSLLRVGSRGLEVQCLQQKIGVTTDGKFGPLTKIAVVAFQSNNGLVPDGIVGPLSRTVLNSSVETNNPAVLSPISAPVTPPPNPVSDPDIYQNNEWDQNVAFFQNVFSDSLSTLQLSQISGKTGSPGSLLSIYGSGFTDFGNTVHFGNAYSVNNVNGIGKVKLALVIPSSIPLGKHDIWVTNRNGVSNKSFFFVIIESGTQAPIVERIEPQSGPVGTRVTIYGKNFSKNNNEARTIYGVIPNLKSNDGETITFDFSYPNFVRLQQLKDMGKNVADLNIPINVGIVDDNGASVGSARFTLTVR